MTVAKSTDYYPVWKAKAVYTVKIHLTGTSTTDRSVYSGESVTLPTSLGTSGGKTHEGWTTKSDGTGRFYSAGSTIYPTGNIELFTYWSDPEIVKLNLNDSATLMRSVNVQKGSAYDLSETEDITKECYLLIGWSKSKTSNTAAYALEDSLTVTADTTLYAVWEKMIKVTFHDGEKTTADYVRKGDSMDLPEPKKDGYVFLGWTQKGSDDILETLEPTKDTDLYSKWRVDESKTGDGSNNSQTSDSRTTASDSGSHNVSSTGGSGISMTTIGIGAAVAAIVSVLLVFQIRRA